MHKFNPLNKTKLDNEWRREILPPVKVLESLMLENNDIVADIGYGIGYFTIPVNQAINSNEKYILQYEE